MASTEETRALWRVIKEELIWKANTANRIGTAGESLLDAISEIDLSLTESISDIDERLREVEDAADASTVIDGNFTDGIKIGVDAQGESQASVDKFGRASFKEVKTDELLVVNPATTEYITIGELIVLMSGEGIEWETYPSRDVTSTDILLIYDPLNRVTYKTSFQDLKNYILDGIEQGGTGTNPGTGLNIGVVTANSLTPLTDANVLSSLRAIKEITDKIDSAIELVGQGIGNMYLRKDIADTAEKLISFTQGINVGIYTKGMLGAGGTFRMENGRSILEVDELTVRMRAYFYEVYIKRAQHIGGEMILSAANMVCTEVINNEHFYRCYFNDGDGTVPNTFMIGDFARAQTFGAPMLEATTQVTEEGEIIITEDGKAIWMSKGSNN